MKKTCIKLIKLWRVHGYLDFMFMTQDWKFFLIYYASDTILAVATVTGLFLLAERFDGIGIWTKHQVLFMLGYAMTVMGIVETFFSYNILHISRRLGRGQLDHTLIQPQPVWMSLVTEGFMPFSGTASLIPGIGLIAWSASVLSLTISIEWIGLLLINIVASALVMLSFSFFWGSLAFWAPRAAEEISSSAVRMMRTLMTFPLDGLGTVVLGGLMTILPVGFLAWYPSRTLLGLDPVSWAVAVTPSVALLFFLLNLWIFTKGLQQYGRTGSQRYLTFGFRR